MIGPMSGEMRRGLLAPSILSADLTRLGDEIVLAEAGGADWIHVDVMDGHFVPNLTMGPLIVEACRRATDLPLDVHLMMENPERYLDSFAEAGASGLSVHVETCPHLHQTIQSIKSLGLRAGVVVNPSTPITTLSEIVTDVDLILIMTVNPGFGGQDFIENSIAKIRSTCELRDQIANSHVYIEVDGGINSSTISRAFEAGADVFVAGSAVFHHPDGARTGVEVLRHQLTG
jgi:ribulose-phosphate 3-epimerase